MIQPFDNRGFGHREYGGRFQLGRTAACCCERSKMFVNAAASWQPRDFRTLPATHLVLVLDATRGLQHLMLDGGRLVKLWCIGCVSSPSLMSCLKRERNALIWFVWSPSRERAHFVCILFIVHKILDFFPCGSRGCFFCLKLACIYFLYFVFAALVPLLRSTPAFL